MSIVILHPGFEPENGRLGGGSGPRVRADEHVDVGLVGAIAAGTVVVILEAISLHLAADR
jgi:hypothetical protein